MVLFLPALALLAFGVAGIRVEFRDFELTAAGGALDILASVFRGDIQTGLAMRAGKKHG
jgi:hypothetical protein